MNVRKSGVALFSALTLTFILIYTTRETDWTRESNRLKSMLQKLSVQLRGESLGERYEQILGFCGELCDLTKHIEPGLVVGTVKAKVDCDAIFASEEIDKPSEDPPKPWEQIPRKIQDEYLHYGKVEMSPWFIDNQQFGDRDMEETFVFTKQDVQGYIDAFEAGTPRDNYGDGSNMINKASDAIGVEGKTVLVIGTQQPWAEAVLFTKNPKFVMTLEYGSFRSEFPNHEFVTPKMFRDRYTAGTLPMFDLIVTYSSVEHSGLGRYGDALNPWGDILTIARAWCVTTDNAKLMIGVPVGGKDLIQFNAHRIYGPVLYPYLVTNWKFIWSSQGSFVPGPDQADGVYQPVYLFEKINVEQ